MRINIQVEIEIERLESGGRETGRERKVQTDRSTEKTHTYLERQNDEDRS